MCCPLQSTRKRIEEFKKYPQMVKYYIRAAEKYLQTHPESKMAKKFGNVYDMFTSQVFCNGEKEFKEKFLASPIFGNDAIDTKAFLEKQFNIKL